MAPLKHLDPARAHAVLPALHDRKVMAPLKPRHCGLLRHVALALSMTERSWPH